MKRKSIHVFKDKAGAWRWNLTAGNGRKIATSGESFDSHRNAMRAALMISSLMTVPPVLRVA